MIDLEEIKTRIESGDTDLYQDFPDVIVALIAEVERLRIALARKSSNHSWDEFPPIGGLHGE